MVCGKGEPSNVRIALSTANQFALMKGIIEEQEDVKEMEEILLAQIDLATFKRCVEYAQWVKKEANEPSKIVKPIETKDIAELVTQWEATFINSPDKDALFAVILAANNLECQSLLELTCAKVAVMIKQKNLKECREMFSIQNDFSPQEEEQIEKENSVFERS